MKIVRYQSKKGLKIYQYDRSRYAEYQKAYNKVWWAKIKDKVFGHYGKQCKYCGRKSDLQIDHKLEDGGMFRKQTGLSGNSFYLWIIENNFPDNLQTLCRGCNIKKYYSTKN